MLQDERDVIVKLNHLVVSTEIFSDVIIEFSSFASILSLVPQLITEIETAVDAVITQSVHPNILPMDTIKKKIPYRTKPSVLTPYIKAYLQPSGSYIEYR